MCGSACVQHRERSCRLARGGSPVPGSEVGSSGPGARTGSIEPAGDFWTTRASESETRHCTPRECI